MYQRIDNDNEIPNGFSYINCYGEEEYITIEMSSDITAIDIDGDSVSVYDKDIPKLIKALQAAYDYKMKGGAK